MADETSTFKLDLDSAEFIKGLVEAKGRVSELGESGSIDALVSGIIRAGAVVGVLGAALFAVKGTMDLVFEAEKMKATENQFGLLSTSAGVYSESLLRGLREASGGWVDDISLMKLANEAMAKLETGVEKLPDLIELARKVTSATGKEFSEVFETMSSAVATGNMRQLKALGIVIDAKEAYKQYAISVGLTVSELSMADKQQAMMNAVLSKGTEKFGSVNTEITKNIGLYNQIKATLKEVADVTIMVFDKIMGPIVSKFFGGLKESLDKVKDSMTAFWGSGSEQAEAKGRVIQDHIKDLKKELESLQAAQKSGHDLFPNWTADRISKIKADIETYGVAVDLNQKKISETNKKDEEDFKASQEGKVKIAKGDQDKIAADRAKFNIEMSSLNKELLKEEISHMTTVKQAEDLYNQQRLQGVKDVNDKIASVRAKQAQGEITAANANAQITQLHKISVEKQKVDDIELEKYREQALEQYVHQSQNAFQGVGRAFAQMSEKNKHELSDWGKFGQTTSSAFGSHMTSAFKSIGAGAQSGTDAMKSAFMGMAGDIASHYGEVMLLASVWPPNPVGLAAGAALLALGGALGAASSGSSGGGGSGSYGGGGGGSGMSVPSASATQTSGPKTANLIIQGNLMANDQTARWIVDQVRNAADATDFKISSVGGGL